MRGFPDGFLFSEAVPLFVRMHNIRKVTNNLREEIL